MQADDLEPWRHSHSFGQERKRPGESRTLIVVLLTLATMLAEVAGGTIFGSMALLADGLHMASHAAALGINVLAYVYARRHAHDLRYSFGTGKMNALGGFTGALLLAIFALGMVWQSIDRFLNPVAIAFNQAMLVAAAGLLVNALSAMILGRAHDHHHEHGGHHDDHDHRHDHAHGHNHHHDHNLRSAYLHVLADALTSVLAILALLGAKYVGLNWMDPAMGVLGALLVTRWSVGLLRESGRVLLDRQAPAPLRARIQASLESMGDCRVVDLHCWSIGPELHALIVSLVADAPYPPAHYEKRLPAEFRLAHITIEVNPRSNAGAELEPHQESVHDEKQTAMAQ